MIEDKAFLDPKDYSSDLFWKSIIKQMDFNNFRLPCLDEENVDSSEKSFINHGVQYNLNSYNFRSNEFIKDHDGTHVLFAGCSCTLGTGLDIEDVWSYKLYNELKKEYKLSGYFNLGHLGGSFLSIFHNFILYIEKYGNPDIIFLLLPHTERDEKYFSDHEYTNDFVLILFYKLFEMYCEKNNIILISSSWVIDDQKINMINSIKNKLSNKMYRRRSNAIVEESHGLKLLENNSKTFRLMNLKELDNNIFEYSNNNKDKDNLYEAKDNGRHYGSAFHHAWMIHMINNFYRRINEKTN